MSVLVDTSAWIEYFRNGYNFDKLDFLIDENLVLVNDLILSELIPFLRIRKQQKIIELLCNVNKLKSGHNGVGIPDLIIAQNAKQNHSLIYSLDNHFKLLEDIIKIRTYE